MSDDSTPGIIISASHTNVSNAKDSYVVACNPRAIGPEFRELFLAALDALKDSQLAALKDDLSNFFITMAQNNDILNPKEALWPELIELLKSQPTPTPAGENQKAAPHISKTEFRRASQELHILLNNLIIVDYKHLADFIDTALECVHEKLIEAITLLDSELLEAVVILYEKTGDEKLFDLACYEKPGRQKPNKQIQDEDLDISILIEKANTAEEDFDIEDIEAVATIIQNIRKIEKIAGLIKQLASCLNMLKKAKALAGNAIEKLQELEKTTPLYGYQLAFIAGSTASLYPCVRLDPKERADFLRQR